MTKVRVAVIGVGYLGRHHARIFSELPGADLIAVADIIKERAEEIASRYRCKAFTDYKELLPYVDAISIVTPTTSHYEIALTCMKSGKDVLIEKPFTVTMEEADELINESQKLNRIIQVGHLERFNPAVLAVENLIKSPKFFESERLSPFLGRATDVDVTLDLMIHDIDIILSLCHGRITDIKAIGARVLTDKLDVAKAWIEMDNGIKALITASRLSTEKRRFLKIFQGYSYKVIDYQSLEITRYTKGPAGDIKIESIKPEPKEPLKEELKDFIACVSERRAPRVTAQDGMEALWVALEINRKIKETL
jgi:predicted dehydrogenase